MVKPLIAWLHGGNPYKGDALNLLSTTCQDLSIRQLVSDAVLLQPDKLGAECVSALKANPDDLDEVKKALKELSQQ